jgi:tripartite-type tricarboxylate transporter receptor subunit TctC
LRHDAISRCTQRTHVAKRHWRAGRVPVGDGSAFGFGVPKGTAPEIIATLNKQTNAAVLDPNIKQRFADLAAVVVPPNSPDEFAKFIVENIDKWTQVIKFAGIKPD